MLNALDLMFTMPKQKLLEVLCQRWHKDQLVWWRGEDGCSLQFQNSEIWGSPIVSPRKAEKKKKQVIFCQLFRRHEVHYTCLGFSCLPCFSSWRTLHSCDFTIVTGCLNIEAVCRIGGMTERSLRNPLARSGWAFLRFFLKSIALIFPVL